MSMSICPSTNSTSNQETVLFCHCCMQNVTVLSDVAFHGDVWLQTNDARQTWESAFAGAYITPLLTVGEILSTLVVSYLTSIESVIMITLILYHVKIFVF